MSKGLAKTVIEQGKRIAQLERGYEELRELVDSIHRQTYLNTVLNQWQAISLTPEQNASLEAFLKEHNVPIASPDETEQPEQEGKILLS